jgi:N-acyl homoserine lactone hydrolase
MSSYRTVSHTPGSQMMVVRLPKHGTVVLTSDAVYLEENLDKNILPSVGSVRTSTRPNSTTE